MDSLALIDPSFLVKPNYFTTETSKQSTVGEKVYDLPLEREEGERSTSRIPSQSSFNEQNYPEYNVENIILQEDKMTTNKPLDGAFTDHIYPDYNLVDNSGHEELPGKHTTIRSKTDKLESLKESRFLRTTHHLVSYHIAITQTTIK